MRPMPSLRGQLDQRMAHLQRMGAALERARPGDERQRPVIADVRLPMGT